MKQNAKKTPQVKEAINLVEDFCWTLLAGRTPKTAKHYQWNKHVTALGFVEAKACG